MLLTYWRVHLLYTIPPALLLAFVLRPVLSKRNLFCIAFHVVAAVVYTFPWDSYIIKNHAWTYADWAVTFTIQKVPIEEIFFFVVQSIFTSLLYLLLGLAETPSEHLLYDTSSLRAFILRYAPLLLFPAIGGIGWRYAMPESHTFYLGCILWWITPITTFLWLIAGDHFISRSRTAFVAILVPTAYLCLVDTIALKAGTWHITERTSTGLFVWKDLPVEEALFFLVTNTLLVCGMSAFERSYAVIDTFGDVLAGHSYGLLSQGSEPTLPSDKGTIAPPRIPSPSVAELKPFVLFLAKSLFLNVGSLPSFYLARLSCYKETEQILKVHSKSFYTASFIFPPNVRKDLIILYAFCRVLDDFCDESASKEEATRLIETSKAWLDLLYPHATSEEAKYSPSTVHYTPSPFAIAAFLHQRVPKEAQPAFYLFSTISHKVPRYPFDDLIAGYEWDLQGDSRPIVSEADLVHYSKLVASSVAEMCVWAMWSTEGCSLKAEEERKWVLEKAASMGVALQITNIARDIKEDATKGRIYIPSDWLKANNDLESLSSSATANSPPCSGFPYSKYIHQLLELAESHKQGTSEAIRRLPGSCQAGIRAATGVYIEIGREIEKRAFSSSNSRAEKMTANPIYQGDRVSMTKWQRIRVAIREVYLRR